MVARPVICALASYEARTHDEAPITSDAQKPSSSGEKKHIPLLPMLFSEIHKLKERSNHLAGLYVECSAWLQLGWDGSFRDT